MQEQEFQKLKQNLITFDKLVFSDTSKPHFITLETDESSVAAILYQKNGNDNEIIDCRSKSLNEAESRYNKFERESLALNFALKKFKHYLVHIPVIVLTALPQFKLMIEKKDVSDRFLKFVMDCQNIDYKIEVNKNARYIICDDQRIDEEKEDFLNTDVYIDGACQNNGKENAVASFGVFWGPSHPFNNCGRLKESPSNQRAELIAAIEALKSAKHNNVKHIRLITDSKYLVKSQTEWVDIWKINDWKNSKGENVVNADLHKLIHELAQILNVQWYHVKGHNGVFVNEEAHKLAQSALNKASLNVAIESNEDFIFYQNNDAFCQRAKREKLNGFITKKGVLQKIINGKLKTVLPKSKINEILDLYHNNALYGGHYGLNKTLSKISNIYWWPKQKDDIFQHIKCCQYFQKFKAIPGKPVGKMIPLSTEKPFEQIGIDFVGSFPTTSRRNKHIVIACDYFSKLAITAAIPDTTALTTASFIMKNIVRIHGPPMEILSDQGVQFKFLLIKELMSLINSKKSFTTPYHPRCNGLTERVNKTLIHSLRNFVSQNQRNWDEYLDMITFAYNTTTHVSTGYSPYELIFGRRPRSLIVDNNPNEVKIT